MTNTYVQICFDTRSFIWLGLYLLVDMFGRHMERVWEVFCMFSKRFLESEDLYTTY